MQDISAVLIKTMREKKCSALLTFMELSDGIHIQKSESSEKSCGGLRSTRDIHTNEQALGIHIHGDSDSGI